VLAVGLPASPGVACGEIVTSPGAAVEAAAAGRTVILVRAETSPDDVHGMAKAAGILTATGGLASHAAVVARGWGIPAVVGAASVKVRESEIVLGDRTLAVGETITIDGTTGQVFAGSAAGSSTVVPEAATLMAWAGELGIAIGDEAPGQATSTSANPLPEPPTFTRPDVLRILMVKGYGTPENVAAALLSTPDVTSGLLDGLVADGLAEVVAGSSRLTAHGKSVGKQQMGADSDAWGIENAVAALDAFLALDQRMKVTVTAWQMRDIDGAQAFNDHSDPAYDARVLAELAALHADATAWLQPLAGGLPRLALYLGRLERAIAAARGGDHRYVASPRVDSYHGAWFELHEDLIQLAGRSRAEEVAAGRA
jgi:pyruvate,orthophosphate dikinase